MHLEVEFRPVWKRCRVLQAALREGYFGVSGESRGMGILCAHSEGWPPSLHDEQNWRNLLLQNGFYILRKP